MTCIDGYAMAKKGRAGAALCIAAVGSWIGGTVGLLVLTMVAPPLATIAIRFGPPEYTALLVLGLIFLAYMSSSSLIRTLLMACLGLLLGMIGIDNMTGHFRYSFDLAELGDGIGSSRNAPTTSLARSRSLMIWSSVTSRMRPGQFDARGRASRNMRGIGNWTSAETGTLTASFIGALYSASPPSRSAR